MNKKRSYGLNIGASSILVIMVILSLVCFAALSLASANADYRLSKKLADRTTAYYTACNQAQENLSLLSDELLSIYKDSADRLTYENKIKESLSDSLTFSCPMNENQSLQVSTIPLYPASSAEPLYEITSWQVVTTATLQLDESLPVFLGD